MFCVDRSSVFTGMPSIELLTPSWGKNGIRPCGSQTMRGLIQEVLGNGMSFQGPWGRNQPSCVDHSGHRHCRTHCNGHSNPVDLLEQFFIEDAIRDAHHISNAHKEHQCDKKSTVNNEQESNTLEKEDNISDKPEEVTKTLPNDTVANIYKPWSVSIDMSGCEDVRARSEDNKIVIEGHTNKPDGFMTIKRLMTHSRNVKGEAIKASLGSNSTLTLTETPTSKVTHVTDIHIPKENILQINNTHPCENESEQNDSVLLDTREINMDDSNVSKDKNKDDSVNM